MYFPADPASLHSFPPCLLYQQRGILFIVPVKKVPATIYMVYHRYFRAGIDTLTVRVYRRGPLMMYQEGSILGGPDVMYPVQGCLLTY